MENPIDNREHPWPAPIISWYAVFILFIAYTISFIDRSILALLVQPIKADLNITDTQISLLHGFAFAIFYTILGIPIARLADSKSRKHIIAIGIVIWSLMTCLCGLASKFWHLFLARVGVGVGEAALSPAAYSMIADLFPKERLGRALGVYSMGVYFGAGLAFIIGGAVVEAVSHSTTTVVPFVGELKGWQLVFIIVGLPGLLAAGLALTIKEPVRRGTKASDGAVPIAKVIGYARNNWKSFGSHFLGFSILGLLFNAFIAWSPTLLIRRFEFTAGEAGYLLGILLLVFGSLGIVCGGLYADYLVKRGDSAGTMNAGMRAGIALIPLAALGPIMPSVEWMAVLFAGFYFFAAFPYGAAAAALQVISPNRIRAQMSALYLFCLNLLGIGFGPTLVALITDYGFKDPNAIGQAMAIVGVITAVGGAFVLSRGLKPFRESVVRLDAQTTGREVF